MGTRADFYVGRGPDAEWLGSIAYDGYPAGIRRSERHPWYLDLGVSDQSKWCNDVRDFLVQRDDATLPEHGWPWPWEDSRTTDYAYAFDDGKVWASCFGHEWFDAEKGEPTDENGDEQNPCQGDKVAVFPDMSAQKNVQFGGRRSGLIVVSSEGVF